MPIHDWARVYSGTFHDFHQSWSVGIKDVLNTTSCLPPSSAALIEQRVPERKAALRLSDKEWYADKANRIVVNYKLGRTIAAIEIVSPGNKHRKEAFREFHEKCLEYLRAGVHLLVVDLFPPTKRDPFGVHRTIWDEFEEEDVEFEFPEGKSLTLASYNAGRTMAAYVEPVAVGDVMPDMPLFLFDNYHVNIPLEATYQTTWCVLPRMMQEYVETGVPPRRGHGRGCRVGFAIYRPSRNRSPRKFSRSGTS